MCIDASAVQPPSPERLFGIFKETAHMLLGFLKSVLRGNSPARTRATPTDNSTAFARQSDMESARMVLNVGGNNKKIPLPPQYHGWHHVLLDIDEGGNPDIVCDARSLTQLSPLQFDAIYCSHNLEHYYRHDVARVLAGFNHVLKEDGFIHIRVPDIGELMRVVSDKGLDIDDLLYISPAGPVHVGDVIYGFAPEIERSGNDFFAHKTGFTQKSLHSHLQAAGLKYIHMWSENLEINAIALKSKPSEHVSKLFNIDFAE